MRDLLVMYLKYETANLVVPNPVASQLLQSGADL